MGNSAPDDPDGFGDEDGLPSTAYAVLGILSVTDEELSAREIKTRASFVVGHFYWSPAVSHIRRELERLARMGMVEEREITIGRVRRTQIYQTTERGEEALIRWVSDRPPEEPVVVKNSVLLRVFLGAKAPQERILSVIDARIEQVGEEIEKILWGQRRGEELGLYDEGALRFPRAVGEYTLRSLYFEQGNLRQLRETIVGFDAERFKRDDRWQRGPTRPRRPRDGENTEGE